MIKLKDIEKTKFIKIESDRPLIIDTDKVRISIKESDEENSEGIIIDILDRNDELVDTFTHQYE